MAEIVYRRVAYLERYPHDVPMTVIRWIFSIIEFALLFRFILVFLGASASSPFVAWVYGVTGRLIGPFSGAFPNLSLGGFVLETTTIFAMIGYAIIGWLILELLSLVFYA